VVRASPRHDLSLLTGAYAADAIDDPAERARFEQHMRHCAQCSGEVRGLAETAAKMALASARPAPEPMRDRVLEAVSRTRQLSPAAAHHRSAEKAPRQIRPGWIAAAAGLAAAACLGVATVALHTRARASGERWLATVRVASLGVGRLRPAIVSAASVLVALACLTEIARVTLVESRLESRNEPAAVRVERALAIAPRDAEARWARARLRLAQARRVWESGQAPDGRVLASWEERRPSALAGFTGAIEDAEVAIRARPADPYLHETLARAHGDAAAIDETERARHQAAAFASMRRAIALSPHNPHLYRSLAALALGQPEPVVPVALAAARAAIERDPALLPGIAERFLGLGLTEAQWADLVPNTSLDRLELGLLLDRAGLAAAAEDEFRRAGALGSKDASLAEWALARSLMRRGDAARAFEVLDAAPGDPELLLLRAQALSTAGDAAALDAYRAAVGSAEKLAARRATDPLPADAPRARALVASVQGRDAGRVVRYRRALAEFLSDRQLWEQSAREWDGVIAEAPGDPTAHHERALALRGAGRTAEALEESRRAVALDGSSVPFRMALAQNLWESEQYYQAMNEWRAVLSGEPGNIEARLALARALRRAGDRASAVIEYRRVLDLAPGNADASRGLAALARSAGE